MPATNRHRITPPRLTGAVVLLSAALASGCGPHPGPSAPATLDAGRLPTGVTLDPVGRSMPVGSYPFTMIPAPGGDRVVVMLAGYGANGIQVVQRSTGAVLQTVRQPAAFVGLAFSPDGRYLYASGGNRDVVYRYRWQDGAATLADSFVVGSLAPRQEGRRYPAGIALSPDGDHLYVAENLDDSLAVIDVASGDVVSRVPAGRYPYGVVTAADGTVYSTAWDGIFVRVWKPYDNWLNLDDSIAVGRHPSSMLLSPDGSRLYITSASTDRITIVDTRKDSVIGEIRDTIPNGTGEGSTPDALALSTSGDTLYIAEGDNNAVAVFALNSGASGGTLLGRIPVEWYPSALAVEHDTLFVVNAKGRGTAPNATNGPGPGARGGRVPAEAGYTLGQLDGTVSTIPLAGLDLTALSRRVARANGWDHVAATGGYPPFTHVIYVIKENRTYDQVFGDLKGGDGDTSLVFFGQSVTPNQHAMAERFGIFDRFFVNAEVSADGHNWSTGAYTTDYVQKTVPLNYGGKGRSYDYEGENRDQRPPGDEDVASPANGYLWNLAQRRGITFRNFGEFVAEAGGKGPLPSGYVGLKPYLDAHTDSAYPGFDLDIPDQHRADVWLKALAGWEAGGDMPALQIMRLPNDHTMGASAGALSPRAYAADNDLALGRIIAGLSRSRFWKNTVVFVLEDDAQNGPDHVDSHRSNFLVISAYNRPHTWHRFANTTDVIATIEQILTLDNLSQFDRFGRPLRGIFASSPDLTPYTALTPPQSLGERNPPRGPGARQSANLDFRFEDLVDDNTFNHILWEELKPGRPYPGTRTLTAPEMAGK